MTTSVTTTGSLGATTPTATPDTRSAADTSDLDELYSRDVADLACQCEHVDGQACPHQARWRTSPACNHPECDNASGTWLLCDCCLATWRDFGDPLTVRPLT